MDFIQLLRATPWCRAEFSDAEDHIEALACVAGGTAGCMLMLHPSLPTLPVAEGAGGPSGACSRG